MLILRLEKEAYERDAVLLGTQEMLVERKG